MEVDVERRALSITLATGPNRAHTLTVAKGAEGHAEVRMVGSTPRSREAARLMATLRHVLGLDQDLSEFYALAAGDPDLAWCVAGAGRLLRSPTVFEDVVKTICSTNCSWAATTRMVTALVAHLGPAAAGVPEGPRGRAFPSAEAMAAAGPAFYRDVVRAGYRGPWLLGLARDVADGAVDLEVLAGPGASGLGDDDVERLLRAIPGVGPYAAALVMLVLGRPSRLVLDSWTRPKFAKVAGRSGDAAIAGRFARYGSYAGLAFWLFVTADWEPSSDA